MDPNVTLAQIRRAIAAQNFERAAEEFLALDGWLSREGFLPRDWARSFDRHIESAMAVVADDTASIERIHP